MAGIAFGNGVTSSYTAGTDYRITNLTVTSAAAGALINRTLAWTGGFSQQPYRQSQRRQ